MIFTLQFTVWPSQKAYDTIADLNNGVIRWEDLSPSERAQIGTFTDATDNNDRYYMLTNTHLYTTYTYSGDNQVYVDSNDWNIEEMPLPTNTIKLKKEWNNPYDSDVHDGGESVDLIVTKDGENYLEGDNAVTVTAVGQDNTPGTADDWTSTDDIYISCGLISHTTGNNYVIDEPGHDYSVAEPEEYAYYWDLKADVYHPMDIDGKGIAILIWDETCTGTEGEDYYIINNKKYRVAGQNEDTLLAVNNRRSDLNLIKEVDDLSADHGADPDKLYEFTTTFSADEDIYFSAWNNGYMEIDGTNIQKEMKDGTWTGYYYATKGTTGTTFSFKIKAGWNVRFMNLPVGTEYTITESDPEGDYTFHSAAAVEWNYDGNTSQPYAVDVDTDSREVSGSIENSYRSYTVTVTNQYEPSDKELTVNKAWGGSDGFITAHGEVNVALFKMVEGSLTLIEDTVRALNTANNYLKLQF